MKTSNAIVENTLRWVTTQGGHKVAFDEKGKIAAGNPNVTSKIESGASSARRASYLGKLESHAKAKKDAASARKAEIDKRLGELKKHDAAYWKQQKEALKKKYDGSSELSAEELKFLHG